MMENLGDVLCSTLGPRGDQYDGVVRSLELFGIREKFCWTIY